MSMDHILPIPEGAPLTVISVQLYQQRKHKNAGATDTLFIAYKDEKNEKKMKVIPNPPMEIFFVKPEFRSEFMTPREYFPIENTYAKKVSARYVLSTIYQEMLQQNDPQTAILREIYNDSYRINMSYNRKEILKWPYTLMSDMSVEDYYHIMLGYHYNTMRNHIVDKGYLDIEAHVHGLTSSEQASNLDHVNACTVIFNFDEHRAVKKKPEVFTFLLRDHENYPQQVYFEEHLDQFIETCHKEFDHQVVIKDDKKRVIDFEANYHIMFYNNEADLLQDIFRVVNAYKPDTMSIWNIAYDIPKMAARMEMNGLNYVDVMCDPSIPSDYRFVEMNVDNRPDTDIADRKTFIRTASSTVWIDQMQSYAGIRKGRKAYGSNKLDNIAKIELGVGKLSFDKGIDVTNAPIEDYWRFVLYNITDVMRQVLIDIVTNDCMSMIYDMNQANCPVENLFKQTKYQKQIYYTNYLRKGFVPGNNPNVNYLRGESEEYLERVEEARRAREQIDSSIDGDDYQQDERVEYDSARYNSVRSGDDDSDEEYDEASEEAVNEYADGALNIYDDSPDRVLYLPGGQVGNPDFNVANGTELVKGVPSKHVFDDVMDMDYASEYPWAKYTRSMSKSTQIGRIIIPHKISDRQNKLPMGQEKRVQEIRAYLPGAEFMSDYISHNIFELGNVWFNLPTVSEMEAELVTKFATESET